MREWSQAHVRGSCERRARAAGLLGSSEASYLLLVAHSDRCLFDCLKIHFRFFNLINFAEIYIARNFAIGGLYLIFVEVFHECSDSERTQ